MEVNSIDRLSSVSPKAGGSASASPGTVELCKLPTLAELGLRALRMGDSSRLTATAMPISSPLAVRALAALESPVPSDRGASSEPASKRRRLEESGRELELQLPGVFQRFHRLSWAELSVTRREYVRLLRKGATTADLAKYTKRVVQSNTDMVSREGRLLLGHRSDPELGALLQELAAQQWSLAPASRLPDGVSHIIGLATNGTRAGGELAERILMRMSRVVQKHWQPIYQSQANFLSAEVYDHRVEAPGVVVSQGLAPMRQSHVLRHRLDCYEGITVFTHNAFGGQVYIPQLKATVEVKNGDFLLIHGGEFLHGDMPIVSVNALRPAQRLALKAYVPYVHPHIGAGQSQQDS